jgi:hypothetical protein
VLGAIFSGGGHGGGGCDAIYVGANIRSAKQDDICGASNIDLPYPGS